ncbi:P-loop containing nucleoside triphosphate hydrolase protein [Rhizoctonia solani]|uniref:Cytochrome b-c1 complex subunit 8 n=1 Tax=Rhizoctonia solani TaxID=456999 RepID=A0A8H8P602_9AGAM|nr:P-loop containing nucleoside triphosphate hydrolase protein [Rhizoctonia solani]QRW25820.1 P-loop containing nucleoside triphosphate hydrolase protein [Rhizoctonia solani]
MAPVGLAILGAAYIPALALYGPDQFSLKAVYSRSKSSSSSLSEIVKERIGTSPEIYSEDGASQGGLDALLARPDIDAVIVVLPLTQQPEIVLKALAAGKNVLSEKPVAKDVKTGLDLIEKWEKEYKPKGLIWRVAENFEVEPGVVEAGKRIQAGAVGKVRFFNFSFIFSVNKDNKYYQTSWRTVPDYQGGFLLDAGVHTNAALRRAVLQAAPTSDGHPPHGIMEMSCAASPGFSRYVLTVAGTEGNLTLEKPSHFALADKITGPDGSKTEEFDKISSGVHEELGSFFRALSGQDDGNGEPRGALLDVALIQAFLTSEGNAIELKKLLSTGDIARIEANVTGTLGKRGTKQLKKQTQTLGDLDAGTPVEGVVYKVSDTRIVISVEAESQDIELPERCRVVKLANSITFDRMDRAIDSLERLATQQVSDGPTSATQTLPLAQSLLAMKPLQPYIPISEGLAFMDDNLNDSQKEAVKFALDSPEIALIHGPPGTGKTQTLVEIIRQLVQQGKRVLVCGASNLAVDNLLERLVPHRIPLSRIGHPARVLGNLHSETLDAQAARSDQAALAADAKSELENAMASLAGKGKARLRGLERKKMWEEVKELRKEYRKREKVIVQSVLSEAKIILATCHSSGGRQLANMRFDVVCIDEACQALEAVCWISILKGSKLILAGDPLQLPPTIISLNSSSLKSSSTNPASSTTKNLKLGKSSNSAAKLKATPPNPTKEAQSVEEATGVDSPANSGDEKDSAVIPPIHSVNSRKPRLVPPKSLEVTLFQRLEQMHGSSIKRMLTTQYRMHQKIASFPSETLYGSALMSHESVASHLLRDLPGVSADQGLAEVTSEPVVFFDTAGCEFYERVDGEGDRDEGSRSNENEATLVKNGWKNWTAPRTDSDHYAAQVTLLVSMLRPTYLELEIGTVDGMQGREKDAVILSLVRSNDKREVGFLKEKRRLNVAMTRPRRHLCVVGDSSTVEKGGAYLKKWMTWLENNADCVYDIVTSDIRNVLAFACAQGQLAWPVQLDYSHNSLAPTKTRYLHENGLGQGTTAASQVLGLAHKLAENGLKRHVRGPAVREVSGGKIFYAGSLVAEFPVNVLCQKFPIAKFLGTAVVLWGITLGNLSWVTGHETPLTCLDFSTDGGMQVLCALMVVRYLLGTFEAAVQPSFLLMTSMWYRRAEQGEYVSYWYAMNGLQMVGGLMSYGVSHINNPNIKSWQVLFMMLGIVTVLWGIFIWLYLPDSPMRAKCYNDEDKTLMVERVRANQTGLQNKIFKREQAIEAFTDIQVWFYVLMQILNTLPTSGIGAFGNLIIKDGFGFDVLQTSLLSLVQGTVHILIVTFVAYIARRTQQTLYIMMAICVPMVATTSVLMTVPNGRSTRVGLLIAFYGTFWFNGVAVLLLSLITRNIAGQTKKSIVLTMSLIAWAAGNMIGPQVFQTKDAPRYRVGFTVHLAFYVAQIVVFFALRLILARRNKSKNEVSKQKGRAEGEVNLDNAFDDMTDMENPEFRQILGEPISYKLLGFLAIYRDNQQMGWWGDFAGPKQKGVISYSISPYKQRAFAGALHGYLFNGYARLAAQLPFFAIPFAGAYGVYVWANKRDAFLNSKAGHGHGDH